MNFENGPIQQIFNSKGENSNISFNQWEQEGDFRIKEDNNFLRNTCKASNINVAEVSGEIPTDRQQMLSVGPIGVEPSNASLGCSQVDCGVVPGSASLGHSRVGCGAVPGNASLGCSQVDCVVEPFNKRRISNQVDCLESNTISLDSSQLDCNGNLLLSSSGTLDSVKPADESKSWCSEKTFIDNSAQKGAICSENILRQINGCQGIYISGSVQGVKIKWTTDTGTTRSIISKHVFKRIPKESRPKLEKSNCLIGANGEPLKELGKAIFEIQLGQENFKEEIFVSEIEDDALLGLDTCILIKEENRPVDIKLHENFITFRGKNIEVQKTTEKIRKVMAADNFVIPAYCEKLIDVFIDRYEDDQDLTNNVFCVEPSGDFNNRFSLMMASCVIYLKDQVSTKIRVMNPFKMDVCLKQDDLLGKAELVNPQILRLFFQRTVSRVIKQ